MNAPNKSGWRPALNLDRRGGAGTATGNKALMLEEPLIFEIGTFETTGVDLPDVPDDFAGGANRLGGLAR
ncbi:MAG: aminomethyl-transferring glycine dehydrogenase subunit GcvPB, partial [Tsuneonella troitsensis]